MNTILHDFNQDIWLYIHLGYLKQKVVEGQVWSSAMPHKVNPIDFENAEWNLWLANSLLQYAVREQVEWKINVIGEAFSYMMIAFSSLEKGLWKIDPNTQRISEDLMNNPMVLAEAIQTYLKTRWIHWAYEQLRDFTRGENRTLDELHALIDTMVGINEEDKRALKIQPAEYLGQYPEF